MTWDGIFHAGVWVLTLAGLAMLWRAGSRPDVPWSGKTFLGGLVVGWLTVSTTRPYARLTAPNLLGKSDVLCTGQVFVPLNIRSAWEPCAPWLRGSA